MDEKTQVLYNCINPECLQPNRSASANEFKVLTYEDRRVLVSPKCSSCGVMSTLCDREGQIRVNEFLNLEGVNEAKIEGVFGTPAQTSEEPDKSTSRSRLNDYLKRTFLSEFRYA